MSLSLWLIPHADNPFTKTVQELIAEEVPKQFLPKEKIQSFTPHVTVTPDVDTGGKSPQEWLDNLQLPEFKAEHNEVILLLDQIQAEDPFYRKMNIALEEDANLRKLVAFCRQQAVGENEETAQAWAEKEYRPHLSLLYADLPTKDVANKIALIEMKTQFALGDIFACCGGSLCMGGHLALVDTSKPIDQWQPIAKRETPWAIWRATRNLI